MAARRYSFAIALSVSLMVLAGVLWTAVPANPFTSDPQAGQLHTPPAALHSEDGPLFSDDNPYAGETRLSVASRPSGAMVTLGGDTLGLTPLREQPVPAGVHLISVYKKGHAALDSVVLLRNDRPADVRVALAMGDQPPRARHAGSGESSAARRMFATTLVRGDDLFMQDRYAEAHQAYQRALQLRPGDPAATARLQKAERAMQGEAGGETQQEARREPPPQRTAERTRGRARAGNETRSSQGYAVHRRKGDELFDERKYQKAIEHYEAAQQYRPNDEHVKKRIAEARRRSRVVGW